MSVKEANIGVGDVGMYSSHMRPFTQRTRYRMVTTTLSCVGERSGSQTSLASMTGSTHNCLDAGKLMSMQEDARSRKISTEVIKRSLYKSVTAPCRRRMMNRMSYCSTPSRLLDDSMSESQPATSLTSQARMFQSLPVTPAQSLAVTPAHSPTGNKTFFYGFLSRGTTPRCTTPEPRPEELVAEEEIDEQDCRGLATLFRPHPRYVSASEDSTVDVAFVHLSSDLEMGSKKVEHAVQQNNAFDGTPTHPHFNKKSSFKRNCGILKNANPV